MSELTERRKNMVTSMMRGEIYEAAIEVLGKHGIDGLTMDHVAEAAGIAKGSLYNYFRNKQELLEFIFDKTVEPAKQAAEEILAKPVSAMEKLESILRLWFEHFSTQRGIFDFLFNHRATRELLDSRESSTHADAIEKFRMIFQQGIEEGTFRQLDVTRTAEMFLGAVVMTIDRQMVLGEQRPAEESVGAILEVFVHGMKTRP